MANKRNINAGKADDNVYNFKTPFNADLFPNDDEVNNLPSETIPDQSMTVKEILDRYARGLSVADYKVPIYGGDDDDLPDPAKLDLAERQELAEQFGTELKEINSRQKQRAKAKQYPAPLKKDEEQRTADPVEGPQDLKPI